jgi:hypothetical protein
MAEIDPNNPLEVRFRALREQVESQGGKIHISVTVGDVDVTALYRIHPLPHDDDTLHEQMDDVDRLVADPRFAEASRLHKRLKEADFTLGMATKIQQARITEYNDALDSFREFAVGGGTPVESQKRDDIQSVVDTLVRGLHAEGLFADQDEQPSDDAERGG